MNRMVVGGIVAVVALAVVVGAYAFASGDGEDGSDTAIAVSPTAIASTPTAVPPTPTPQTNVMPTPPSGPSQTAPGAPVQAPPTPTKGPDSPVSSTPIIATPGPPPGAPPTPPGAPPLPPGRHAEPAPIDGLDITVAESFPPQYFLAIKAGLPSGCTERYTHSVVRSGDVITVTVLNSVASNAICTAIYGTYELNVPLGMTFDSGKTYTVNVNDKSITFTAQ